MDEASAQVVQLVAGTYNLTSNGAINIPSFVTLRGAVDANGRPATKFILPKQCKTGGAFAMGEGGPDQGFLAQASDLTESASAGAMTVKVATNPGYVVGELVDVDQAYGSTYAYLSNPYSGYNQTPYIDSHTAQPGGTTNGGVVFYGLQPSPFVQDQLLWPNPDHFNMPISTNNSAGDPTNRAMFCRLNRMLGQTNEVVSVTGTGPYVLTFNAPLHSDFLVENNAQVTRHARYQTSLPPIITKPVQWAGLENVFITGGCYNGHVGIAGAKYCWAKNVELASWLDSAFTFTRSFRCELRDSYIHQGQMPDPGGGGYAIDVNWHSADNLIENTIVWAANKVIVMRASGGGNVVGYSYFEDGFGEGYPSQPESGMNASHFLGSHMELFEGSQSWNLASDTVWGNSIYITFFRNHATGLRRNVNETPWTDNHGNSHTANFQADSGGRTMAALGATSDYFNYVGNVFGYPGMPSPGSPWIYENISLSSDYPTIWNVGGTGNDVQATQARCTATMASTLRDGNYDYGTNLTHWHGIGGTATNHQTGSGGTAPPTVATLPDSLYITSGPPPFFGNNTWPWVDGTIGTGDLAMCGSSYCLPARARFDAMFDAGTLEGPP